MADIHKFSERVIDLAERVEDVADAVGGKRRRRSVGTRWLLIPAAGAGLYALGASGSFTRNAKNVMNQAKTRAADLSEDLVDRVQQVNSQTGSGARSGRQSARSSTARTKGRSRRTTSAR